jgi:hypothetical protein
MIKEMNLPAKALNIIIVTQITHVTFVQRRIVQTEYYKNALNETPQKQIGQMTCAINLSVFQCCIYFLSTNSVEKKAAPKQMLYSFPYSIDMAN